MPTSYMVCQTRFDFFGGYDFAADGGFVHVADRHIAPGKKQWTWGDHGFGHAWDRELTDANGPYVELMAGAYTDNQPDFTYLLPYETKTFSQYWWPIQGLGPVQNASTRAALRLVVAEDRSIDFGVAVPARIEGARLVLKEGERSLIEQQIDLNPGAAWKKDGLRLQGDQEGLLHAVLYDREGREILSYQPVDRSVLVRDRKVATQPAAPEQIPSTDELYFTGEHLEQYRHPTRSPEPYWEEALRRDPSDARCRIAMGRRALERGEFARAKEHFLVSIARLTSRHPNPVTGEAHYYLGITLRWLGEDSEARDVLAKAAWNSEWRTAAGYQLATLDCREDDFGHALQHLDEALDTNRRNSKARVLKAKVLRKLNREAEASVLLERILKHDPLDHWARWECEPESANFARLTRNDGQTILDLVFDLIEAGFRDDAARLLCWHHETEVETSAVPNPLSVTPMTRYLLASLRDTAEAWHEARGQSPDRFFPSRLEEYAVLCQATARKAQDPVASYALGNFLYDRRRHADAIAAWEASGAAGADFATVHRNLGIGYWNVRGDGEAARASYLKALAADPQDGRVLSEYDQLRKKLNDSVAERLAFLEARRQLALERDDCAVELATLYNLSGQPARALDLLTTRRFHPWEGGEGAVLRQFTTAQLILGREALAAGDADTAHELFFRAMDTPENLGEAYHLLQAKADVNYWIGRSLAALEREDEAKRYFEESAAEAGDFADMAVTEHSPLSWFRGLSLRELRREDQARELFESLRAFGEAKLKEKAEIDYFATSLPNLLVFEENLQARRDAENHLLIALAWHGLGREEKARQHLEKTLAFTNSDLRATELRAILEQAPASAASCETLATSRP